MTNATRRIPYLSLTLTLALSLTACRPAAESTPAPESASEEMDRPEVGGDATSTDGNAAAPVDGLRADALRAYADLVHASYADSAAKAAALTSAIEAFLATPTDAALADARDAWTTGISVFSQTEVFRFYGGPIDAPDTGPEGRINAWPLDEAYLDYVEGQPEAGLVQAGAAHPQLTTELLLALNAQGGETSISTGWHAIEFLLWGQDLSTEGPGARPAADYRPGAGPNVERRRELLRLMAAQLETDLLTLVAAWDPAVGGNYRAEFLDLPPEEALGKVLTGMGSLSGAELMGERMTVPFSTQDQEEEVNCFSDTSVAAFLGDQDGIGNVWRGAYGDTAMGPGLGALLEAEGHHALAAELGQALAASREAIAAIPAPFDQAILGIPGSRGPKAIEAALAALELQTALLGEAATALGVTVRPAE
jgi:putative iron-regulated protein